VLFGLRTRRARSSREADLRVRRRPTGSSNIRQTRVKPRYPHDTSTPVLERHL